MVDQTLVFSAITNADHVPISEAQSSAYLAVGSGAPAVEALLRVQFYRGNTDGAIM